MAYMNGYVSYFLLSFKIIATYRMIIKFNLLFELYDPYLREINIAYIEYRKVYHVL